VYCQREREVRPAKAHKSISNGHSVTVTPNGRSHAEWQYRTAAQDWPGDMLKGGVIMDVTDGSPGEIARKPVATAK